MPEEKYFRLCPECHRFFYSKRDFLLHPCLDKNGGSGNENHNSIADSGDSLIDSTPEPPHVDTSIVPEIVPTNPPVTADERQANQRYLRNKYLTYLRKHGIDMAGERSFKKLENAYQTKLREVTMQRGSKPRGRRAAAGSNHA